MKLFIQIPCFNEEQTLATTLADLPRELDGITDITWVVIDDGSTDSTEKVARENGVDIVVRHPRNLGLARAFMTGLNTCLNNGADIIVNTDADNQYAAESIIDLVRPILEERADLVVGARPIEDIEEFSGLKKFFQKLGSWVVRVASNTNVVDAPSGFRAMSKNVAARINVFSNYTYTLETIIQAGQNNFSIQSVPVKTNKWLRPSRLVSSMASYIKRSVITIIRVFAIYRPFRFFMSIAIFFLVFGGLIGLRFLYFYLSGHGDGHIQSLILASILVGIGSQSAVIAFLGDMMSANRRMLEEIQYQTRLKNINSNQKP